MSNIKVLQPMRFVDAFHTLTPTQLDLVMLVHLQIGRKDKIKDTFSIDLKPYFKAKGISLKAARQSRYDKVCQDLLAAKISFKYHKGNRLYSHHNLFNYCSVNEDFIFNIQILEDALPLFYINRIEEGHFKNNRLIKNLFEQSPENDIYVSYLPKTYIDFEEGSEKRLFGKLLQYRTLGSYQYSFGKDELYWILGYGYYRDKNIVDKGGQHNIFNIIEQEFVQTKYKGSNGWKNLRPFLNKWLAWISDHKKSGVTIDKEGKNYFKTQGNPIRNILISVKYDKKLSKLTGDQEIAFEFLKEFKLTETQILKILSDFDPTKIKKMVYDNIIKKDGGYCDMRHSHYPPINNLPGFIWQVVFGYTRGF